MASEHNRALTAPELFSKTVRVWIEEKPLSKEIESI
jgi:hypothetical protein